MAPEEKPYRVYRGGRTKGKVPTSARSGRGQRERDRAAAAGSGGAGDGSGSGGVAEYRGPGARPRKPNWRRRILIGVAVLFVLFVVWAVASYLQFSSGVSDANKRLPSDVHAALSKQSGLLLSHSTTILLLGTDNADLVSRQGDRHSDSIVLLRTDPSHHRLYYLSIPRDLEVPIPGVGTTKINAAMQAGGPALAVRTIRDFTGLPIDHVVVVNFGQFKDLIDALGGVTIDVPKAILSDKFDCPYTAAKCETWKGWRFAKGSQHMNGQRALIYSRVRVNQLDPSESDITREARQQAVLQAVMSKMTSPGTLLGLPFHGSKLVKPLATDLSASQLMQLAWVKFRSSNGSAVHCRLGGDFGGGGNGSPSEDNPLTIAMFLGRSAPQPPPAGEPFAPGCVVGKTLQ